VARFANPDQAPHLFRILANLMTNLESEPPSLAGFAFGTFREGFPLPGLL
jgi:hypothetical protein